MRRSKKEAHARRLAEEAERQAEMAEADAAAARLRAEAEEAQRQYVEAGLPAQRNRMGFGARTRFPDIPQLPRAPAHKPDADDD